MNQYVNPNQLREAIRSGGWRKPTAGLLPGYVQANLAILQKRDAYDFLLFAMRNPQPCPIIEVTEPGSPFPVRSAPGGDLRTDIPKYRIYRKGILEAEETSIINYWQDDFVAFLIGCSFTFENALIEAGIPIRHIDEGKNVPMYIINKMCVPAGIFQGPMVVSMRPVASEKVVRAVQVTSRFPAVHGAPVHIGDPAKIGIRNINQPDFGDSVSINAGEVPVFWACGVTPQAVAMAAKPEIMIAHSPGHMFITDLKDQELSVF